MLLEITHTAVLHLQSFSYLVLILFVSYFVLQIVVCLVVHLLASSELVTFYDSVTFPWKKFSLVTLISCKIVKTSIDSGLASAFNFFHSPTNSICWIAFGSTSYSFCLLKSTAINLWWFLYIQNLINIQ